MTTAAAIVQTGPGTLERHEVPLPDVGPDEALVRVEAVGICGSDVDLFEGAERFFAGRNPPEYPVIRGHEPVGVLERVGAEAAKRRGLRVGDRVAVDPFIPCGICAGCLSGNAVLCTGFQGQAHTYGAIPLSQPPGLWGGFASHLFVAPNTVLHRIPPHVSPADATLFNPLGAGIYWGIDLAGTTVGATVVVLGAGQRGICSALAAKTAGASLVVVTGLGADEYKLDVARQLGADVAVDVDRESVVDVVAGLTGGRGVDVVVDTTPRATQPFLDAIAAVRHGGRIVLGGLKSRSVPEFPVDLVVRKSLTVAGARGIHPSAYMRAIELVASGRFPLDRLRSHVFALDDAERAIRTLGGEFPDERPLNIVVTP